MEEAGLSASLDRWHGEDQMNDDTPKIDRLPRVVYVLAAGTFLMGTTEFMIAGLLPDIADGLGVSESRSGLLITAFAIGMIVGSPVMALVTRRLPQRTVLTLALLVFAAGHVVAALSDSFTILLAARVLTALATGAFWAVAAVAASQAAGPGSSSRAIGVVIGGLTLANVIGVPIGTWAGQLAGWRGPFWALAVLALAGAAVIGRLIPDTEPQELAPVRTELAALRNRHLWLALSACAFVMGGVLATFTYISPLLTDHAGIAAAYVPLVLIGFGIGALAGTTIGGRLGDRRPLPTALVAAGATALVLLALATLSGTPAIAVVLIFLMGVTGFCRQPHHHRSGGALRRPGRDPRRRAQHLGLQHRHRRRLLGRGHRPGLVARADRPGAGRRGHRRVDARPAHAPGPRARDPHPTRLDTATLRRARGRLRTAADVNDEASSPPRL
jgi:predicted MFS family arabinose efflux permease